MADGAEQEQAYDASLELKRLRSTLQIRDDVVVYSPKAGVMSKTYPEYEFDRSDWDSNVGEDAQEGMIIKFKIVECSASTYEPDDPRMPKPDGGFKHSHKKCKIVSAEKS
eukprot:TRINITY_DN70086_c0_g1_i1.p1 TRINITY_DN70086_c0_g1~~TRINITY_DN70086_c0_g1_i1.p1  ORF type:complete len:110 (-),score=29.46 TRINITY_DN70086_c0_g1_i1:257-586(-)